MLEALIGLALIAQGMDDWQEDEDGDEALLLAFTAYDMRIGRRTSFRISEVGIQGERTPFVQLRIQQRQGGSAHQMTGLGCPAFRPLIEAAAQLPMPAPALVRIGPITPDTRAPADWYRLEGTVAWPDGRRVPIRVESVEEEGTEPSPIANWGRSLMRAFQDCIDKGGMTDD